jgi:hypothetical protein
MVSWLNESMEYTCYLVEVPAFFSILELLYRRLVRIYFTQIQLLWYACDYVIGYLDTTTSLRKNLYDKNVWLAVHTNARCVCIE